MLGVVEVRARAINTARVAVEGLSRFLCRFIHGLGMISTACRRMAAKQVVQLRHSTLAEDPQGSLCGQVGVTQATEEMFHVLHGLARHQPIYDCLCIGSNDSTQHLCMVPLDLNAIISKS